jgi:AraC-like DNA-binding protein
VVADELGVAPERALHLPSAQDERLRTVTDLLHDDPAQGTTLADLGARAGTSERTLSRLFHSEFGMSFQRWRTILRVQLSLALLADGRSVTDTANECGWSNPSSFIDAFAAVVGQTPGRYLAAVRATPPRP